MLSTMGLSCQLFFSTASASLLMKKARFVEARLTSGKLIKKKLVRIALVDHSHERRGLRFYPLLSPELAPARFLREHQAASEVPGISDARA